MKKVHLILFLILTLVVAIGGFLWFQQKEKTRLAVEGQQGQNRPEDIGKNDSQNVALKPSADYPIRPDFSKEQDFKDTLILQKGVSVRYGNGWIGKKNANPDDVVSGQLAKTVNGRAYMIILAEIEYPSPNGKFDDVGIKVYDEVQINGKPHTIVVTHLTSSTDTFDFSYVSACSVMSGNACPIQLGKTNLLVMLEQNVSGAQEPKGLDFTRRDDQQILAEFAEIASTLQY
jgi:hypothetical protein